MTLPREYRFRMELHALDRKLLVPHAHYFSIFTFTGDLKTARQTGALDGQRMIACNGQWALQAGKHAQPAMRDLGKLSVHHPRRTYDAATECLANCLVAKTYAEDRNRAGEAFDQRHANASLGRRAGAGRNNDLRRLPGLDLLQRQCVVTVYADVGAQFTQILHEVVGKAVVIIDHKNHASPRP